MNPTATSTWNAAALAALAAGDGRPVLLTAARVVSLDPVVATMEDADVLVGGPVVVGVGPGIVTAAGDDDAIVVDCTGHTVVPAVVDLAAAAGARATRADHRGTIRPGERGDLLVVPTAAGADVATAVATLLREPERVAALFVAGAPVIWAGADVPGHQAAPEIGEPATEDLIAHPRLGTWIDGSDFLHQELRADGRYDEIRGGRPHAFEGRYWIRGDRIDYLDDLGFWAYGTFRGDVLEHAGYVMRRGGTGR